METNYPGQVDKRKYPYRLNVSKEGLHIIKLRNAILSRDKKEEVVQLLDEILQPHKYEHNGVPLRKEKYNPQELKSARRTLCIISRMYLMVVLAENQPNHIYYKVLKHDWLFARCMEVERDPDNHLDLWPRGHFKTTIITKVGCIQELLLNPKLTILIITYANKTANEFKEYIRKQFEMNEDLKYLFDDILYANPKKDAPSGEWTRDGLFLKSNTRGGFASIAVCSIEGGGKTGHHAQLLVLDDIINDQSVTTEDRRQKVNRFFDTSSNLGSKGGDINRRWIVGTRYHAADTYQYILDKGLIKYRVHPATHNGQMDGIPVYLSIEEWEREKLDDSYVVACNMLLNPRLANTSDFALENLQFCEYIPSNLNIFIMVDPAQSKKTNADYTSISVVGVKQISKHANASYSIYLLDGVRDRMNFKETWTCINQLYSKWSTFNKVHGNGRNTIDVFYEKFGAAKDDELIEEYQSRDHFRFEVEIITPKGDKKERIRRLIPSLKAKQFFIPKYVISGQSTGACVCELKLNHVNGEFTLDHIPAMNHRKNDGTSKFTNIAKYIAGGSRDLSIQENYSFPVFRRTVEGKYYDYILEFLNEYLNFPNGEHDDIIDSISAIYAIKEFNSRVKVYS